MTSDQFKALLADHPRTPEGIEEYTMFIGYSDERGRPLTWESLPPRIPGTELPVEQVTYRIRPTVVERHAGEGWMYGWHEELRIVVLWPDPWTGKGARKTVPLL